jgi:hypothetical protein
LEKWNVIDFRTHLFKLQHDQIKLSEWLFTVVVTVIVIILVIVVIITICIWVQIQTVFVYPSDMLILKVVFVWPFDILSDRILSILNVLHPLIKVPIRSYFLQILQYILPTPFVTWYSSHSNILNQWGWNSRIQTYLSYSCFRWCTSSSVLHFLEGGPL